MVLTIQVNQEVMQIEVFTTVEPFGEHLFNLLRIDDSEVYDDGIGNSDNELNTFNPHQEEYVYRTLYKSTKTIARDNGSFWYSYYCASRK